MTEYEQCNDKKARLVILYSEPGDQEERSDLKFCRNGIISASDSYWSENGCWRTTGSNDPVQTRNRPEWTGERGECF